MRKAHSLIAGPARRRHIEEKVHNDAIEKRSHRIADDDDISDVTDHSGSTNGNCNGRCVSFQQFGDSDRESEWSGNRLDRVGFKLLFAHWHDHVIHQISTAGFSASDCHGQ
jgi:hypothetical protein